MDKVNHCFIFARGGSKGLPRKNLMEINKVPLIGHSIKTANGLKNISKVFVSTDSDEIAETAHNYGAEIIQRPAEYIMLRRNMGSLTSL